MVLKAKNMQRIRVCKEKGGACDKQTYYSYLGIPKVSLQGEMVK